LQFAFNLWNHNEMGRRSLEDPMGIIGHQLRDLGHRVVWLQNDDEFLAGDSGINVVIEGFTPFATAKIAAAHAQSARFVCVATEEPTPKGFNHGRDGEMVRRQAEFPNAAKFFDGILYLVPGDHVHQWYGAQAPSAYAELGYAPTLVRPMDWQEPQYDFGFFGSLSKRRLKILKKLAKTIGTEKAVRVEATFPSQTERDRIMREARVIVQIRKNEEMGLVSSSRCNTALHLGRPVVAEPHLLSKPWDEVVKFSSSLDGFYNDCILARTAWKGVHAAQMDRFRTMMTAEFCVGRALREIGIMEPRLAVA
jgi:hypothetical protein